MMPEPTMQTPAEPEALVSVVIVLYNAANFLPTLIGALRRQTYRRREYIVVDNASMDNSAAFIAREMPEAMLIRLSENRGFAAGNNAALPYCHGKYIAFLNPDTDPEPEWLAPLVATLDGDPTIGLATAKIVLMEDHTTINTCGNDVHLAGFASCRGLGAPTTAYNDAADVAAVSGAAFLIRSALMARLGGFDESFFMYVEDTDLSWRALLLGMRCRFVPASIVAHRYALALSARKTYYLERNRLRMLLTCYRARSLLLLGPALALGELAAWGYALMQGSAHLRAKAAANGWIVRHWREIRARRRQVQATRVVGDRTLLTLATPRLPIALVHPGSFADAAARCTSVPFAAFRRIALMIEREQGSQGTMRTPSSRAEGRE